MSKNSASAAKCVPFKESHSANSVYSMWQKKYSIQRGLHFMDKMYSFHARSQNFEKLLSVSSCLSVRTKQLSFQCTEFHKILYLSMFRKSIEKIQILLISDKNNRYFTWRPIYIFDHISLSSSQNKKCVRQKL